MKQMPCSETSQIRIILMALMVVPALIFAQVFDTTPPRIAHQPVKLGRSGRSLPVVAHISDNSGIKSVILHMQYDGQVVESEMIAAAGGESTPVTIQTRESVTVYSGPGESYKNIGTLPAGAQVDVTLVRSPYYRIHTANGLVGYIPAASADIVETGQAYRATIPAEGSTAAKFSYQISALDDFGNESRTAITPIRFISAEEIARMQQGMSGGRTEMDKQAGSSTTASPTTDQAPQKRTTARGASKPVYKKPVFWIVTAAVGGGAYYFLSGDEDKSSSRKGTVDIVVGW